MHAVNYVYGSHHAGKTRDEWKKHFRDEKTTYIFHEGVEELARRWANGEIEVRMDDGTEASFERPAFSANRDRYVIARENKIRYGIPGGRHRTWWAEYFAGKHPETTIHFRPGVEAIARDWATGKVEFKSSINQWISFDSGIDTYAVVTHDHPVKHNRAWWAKNPHHDVELNKVIQAWANGAVLEFNFTRSGWKPMIGNTVQFTADAHRYRIRGAIQMYTKEWWATNKCTNGNQHFVDMWLNGHTIMHREDNRWTEVTHACAFTDPHTHYDVRYNHQIDAYAREAQTLAILHNKEALHLDLQKSIEQQQPATTEISKMAATKFGVETRVYVNGEHIAGMSDDQLVSRIAETKRNIKSIQDIDVTSKFTARKVADMEKMIEAYVAELDSRVQDEPTAG